MRPPVPNDPALSGWLDTGIPEPSVRGRGFDRLLLWATDHEVSDVTIQANQLVIVERYGRLFPVTRRRSAAEAYQ